jgi:hypothetical protein
MKKKYISASYSYVSFDEIVETTELIALVEIKSPVRELDTKIPKTVYKAKIMETYLNKTNETAKEIEIAQQGTDSIELSGIIRFQKGDLVLLFLRTSNTDIRYKGLYGITGAEAGTFWQSKTDPNFVERLAMATDRLEDILEKEEMENRKNSEATTFPDIYKIDNLLKKVEARIKVNESAQGETQ